MRAKNLPGFAHACHAHRKLAGFCSRMPCAPKTCRVLLPHAMRAKNLPGFAHACHARQKLAGFCSRTPCAPKTRRVLLAHAMRTKNLPGFAPARHAHRKLAGFCSRTPCAPKARRVLLAHAMRTKNLSGFPRRRPCAPEMPLVFPLISRASSQGRNSIRPPRGHSSKRKGAIDGSGGAPDTACRQPSRRRNCGRSGRAFGDIKAGRTTPIKDIHNAW